MLTCAPVNFHFCCCTESKQNSCGLVWQGVVKEKVFKKFDLEICRTEAAAKTFLKLKGLQHYWDLAKGHSNE